LGQELEAEPDWSAASFWYAMLALSREGEVFFPGLQASGLQGDERVADLFVPLGVQTVLREDGVLILKKGNDVPTIYRADFESSPDLAMPVIVACAALGIEGRFTGLKRLAIKESDRLAVISRELASMGRVLQPQEDAYCLHAGLPIEPKNLEIKDDDDHRVAMAFATLAVMGYEVEIRHADVVAKSYPGFWHDLRQAGFTVAEYC
jgi:3-phosphoshikimate 1-carboxyvinyltransferase